MDLIGKAVMAAMVAMGAISSKAVDTAITLITDDKILN